MTTYARTFAVTLLATLALVAAPERDAAATSSAPAGARLLSCRHSPAIEQRTAVVGTWMRPLPTAGHLALRVNLYQRTPGTRWTLRSDVPGLGTWTTPSDPLLGTRPGDVFKYRQAVGHLVVPASYRFQVTFRWLGADGADVQEASVTTAICRQPDQRPDLVVDSVDATPLRSGLVRYAILLGNEGRSPVAHASLAATFPGDAVPGLHLRSAGRVLPGGSTLVTFVGPGCSAGEQPASFAADPSNAVDEVDEANNELAASCPAP
jgi:hypothetical protein